MKSFLYVIGAQINTSHSPSSRGVMFQRYFESKGFDSSIVGFKGNYDGESHQFPFLPFNLSLVSILLNRMLIAGYLFFWVLGKRSKGTTIFRDVFLSGLLGWWCKLCGVNYAFDFHAWFSEEIKSNHRVGLGYYYTRFFEKLTLLTFSKALTVNSQLAKQLPEKIQKNIVTNGFSPEEFIDLPEDPYSSFPDYEFRLVFPGTHGAWSDLDLLSSAAKKTPEVGYFVIGDGPACDHVKKQEFPSNFHLLGRLPKKVTLAFVRDADVGLAAYSSRDAYTVAKDNTSNRKIKDYLYLGKPMILSDVIPKDGFFAGRD